MRAVLVALVVLSWASVMALAGEVALVRDGKPTSVIVIPRDASDVTVSAAHVLQGYLKKISHAEVPVFIEESLSLPDLFWLNGQYTVISLGSTRFAKDHGVDLEGVEPEGFRIETKPIGSAYGLFILGREDAIDTTRLRSTGWLSLEWPIRRRGTLFGVCALLEDYLGVRWLWPGELGQVIPSQRDVKVPQIHRTEAPALPIRIIRPGLTASARRDGSLRLGESPESMLDRVAKTNEWTRHMRMGQSLVIDQNHAFRDVFYDAHFAEHPEWFALMPDGRRYRKPPGLDRSRLCFSNRELHQEVARMVFEAIAENPAVFSCAIGLDDVSEGDQFCQCDACKAFGPTLSDRVFRFSSEVARLVAARYPDKHVTQFAYAQWQEPPVQYRIDERVVISYVGVYTHGYLYAPDRRANRQLWDRWVRMLDGKMLWRPNMPVSLGVPVVFIHQMAEDLRHFRPHAWGADVDFLEGSWAVRGLDWYVLSRLLWDPGQDVDAIIDDYCQSGFGPAARPVREYFRQLELHSRAMAEAAPGHGYTVFARFVPSYYTPDKIEPLQRLLTRARELAGDDTIYRRRVDFLQVGLDWTKLSMPAWHLFATDGDREAARPLVDAMFKFLHEHRESYAIHAGYIESNISWMWREFFGQEVGWKPPTAQ